MKFVRAIASLRTLRAPLAAVPAIRRAVAVSARSFSTDGDSHNDFKPKVKAKADDPKALYPSIEKVCGSKVTYNGTRYL